ncbi:hypothetical protein SAMN05443662_1217 [Sulfurivirga caldicuralii]|uniref:Uncharacterized protein n=1 Tax=Sulfurivirga caldicuralii TaxID=364032 RepID=A0A1N6G6R5_9GAMM|nr:YeeE/YedE thiosulfate transporter family protein [Sulfurivirga caldicuralii]SIO03235.1 hypothetical protein SAMN05443662_1217 [Sulfurivirga caldicuralii]
MKLLLAIILGGAFGFVLHRIGATNPTRLIDMLRLSDLKLEKVILFSIGTTMITLFTINTLFPGAVHFSVRAAYWGVFVGGLIFGLGFALSALCPGTGVAALGEGRKDAVFYVLGGLVGTFLLALSWEWLAQTALFQLVIDGTPKPVLAEGVVVRGHELPALIHLPGWLTALIFGGALIALAFVLPRKLRDK